MNFEKDLMPRARWLPLGRHEPLPVRHYTWAAIAVGAASVGLSAYEYASAPGPPKPPNYAAATRAGTEAQAQTLPDMLRLEAAAQQGKTADYMTYNHESQQQFVKVPVGFGGGKVGPGLGGVDSLTNTGAGAGMAAVDAASGLGLADVIGGALGIGSDKPQFKYIPYNAADWWQDGGKYASYLAKNPKFDLQKNLVQRTVKVPGGEKTADFTGYGTADIQGAVAAKTAANQLALRQKYDPQFIAEALKEEAQANPQGVAARAQEQNLLQQEINATPERPVANLLDQQVQDQLKAGKGLDSIADSTLRDAVAQATGARGEGRSATGPDYSEPLTTGAAGQKRLTAAEQTAGQWLASGETPEDVQYRREQQNLADLSSFISGQTPQSQFKNLSGAQQGPTPMVQGQMSQNNPNAGPQTAQAAMGSWQTQLQQASNTANPWMAGLSAMLKGATAVGNSGVLNGG